MLSDWQLGYHLCGRLSERNSIIDPQRNFLMLGTYSQSTPFFADRCLQKRATAKQEINDMLEAINKAEDCFTGARYNVLRVVAAYPLDANSGSRSSEVQDALKEDNHPLASLDHVQLLASLTRCDATPSVLSSLSMSLKRVRIKGDTQVEVQHISKSRKTSGRTSKRTSAGTSRGTSSGRSSGRSSRGSRRR